MSKVKSNLGWGERLAIVDHFGLDDKTATATFGVSTDELATARELAAAGTIPVAEDVDFSQYENELGAKSPSKGTSSTSTTKPASGEQPVTATKPKKEPKKRGRKGDKIKNAFGVIPTTPVDAEAFIAEHNISLNVLRQAKRFDTSGLTGAVHVRKDKDTGTLMVWRDDPTDT